jgi:pimeloyl-ACP methyl ester carboxylesterase
VTRTIGRWATGSILVALLASGCVPWQLRGQQERIDATASLQGRAATATESSHPLVVFLVRMDGERPTLVDHFVLRGAGRWRFTVAPGSYAVGAFEDLDADGRYDAEPALRAAAGPRYDLDAGERLEGIELLIPPDGRIPVEGPVDVAGLQARTPIDQERFSLGRLEALGRVVELTDARFDRENGRKGLWRRWDFLFDVGPGIYFLEACDPSRTPVLFVHGMTGGPRDFAAILADLDRSRFEPWLYYYPSGARLDHVSDHLVQQVAKLRLRCRFDELFVVAHSMGGLVARSFILKQRLGRARGDVTLFVSIATPWSGQAAARFARLAPAGLDLPPSFHDVAPQSAFIAGLFFDDPATRRVRRRLPAEASYHLVYGFKRTESSPGASADGVVQLSSGARLEAQEEAHSQRAFDYGHAEILRGPEVVAHLEAILFGALEGGPHLAGRR